MHADPLLLDIIVLLTASLPIVYLFQRLSLPAVVGLLATGVLIGPSALAAVDSTERVSTLAEVGVILLLFTIGIEFSLERLARISRVLVGAGSVQVGGTLVLASAAAWAYGFALGPALIVGAIIALSSTAVTLAVLEDRGELESQHGGLMLAILLFQDLCVLPILLLLPIVAGGAGATLTAVFAQMILAVVVVALTVYTAKTLLPELFRQILRLRSRELFIGTVVVVCFGTAWLTSLLGLSLAIGAFLAGLLISESEYSHQVVAEILPLRDLFSSVFFVSVGMLLELDFLIANAALVAAATAFVFVLKSVIAGAAVLPFRSSPRLAVLVGLGLAQVGEFSFVLAGEASQLGAITGDDFQLVLAVSVITMMIGPVITGAAGAVAARTGAGAAPAADAEPVGHGHVVVIGYGVNGRNLARVLSGAGIRYTVIDLDSESVESARGSDLSIFYGDATRASVLRHADVANAAVVVVTISDPAAARRIVAQVRALTATAAVIVRTRYVAELEELSAMGADEVIPDEFETSVELFSRVLGRLNIPRNVISAQVDVVRSKHYALLRGGGGNKQYVESLYELFTAATTITFLIREGSPAAGRSLGELELAGESGARVLDVVRKGEAFTGLDADFVLEKGDILVLMGNHAEIASARSRMEPDSVEGA